MVWTSEELQSGDCADRSRKHLSWLDCGPENRTAASIPLVIVILHRIHGSQVYSRLGVQPDCHPPLSMVWEEKCVYDSNQEIESEILIKRELP